MIKQYKIIRIYFDKSGSVYSSKEWIWTLSSSGHRGSKQYALGGQGPQGGWVVELPPSDEFPVVWAETSKDTQLTKTAARRSAMNFIVADSVVKENWRFIDWSASFSYLIWRVDLYKFSPILLFFKRKWITTVLFLSRWDRVLATDNICSADT